MLFQKILSRRLFGVVPACFSQVSRGKRPNPMKKHDEEVKRKRLAWPCFAEE